MTSAALFHHFPPDASFAASGDAAASGAADADAAAPTPAVQQKRVDIRLAISARAFVPAYLRSRGPFQHILSISDSDGVEGVQPGTPGAAWKEMLHTYADNVTCLKFDDAPFQSLSSPGSPQENDLSRIYAFAERVKHHAATMQQQAKGLDCVPGSTAAMPSVLIHCSGGVSRSPACGIILLHALGDTPQQALRHVLRVQSKAVPNRYLLTLAGLHFSSEEIEIVRGEIHLRSNGSRSDAPHHTGRKPTHVRQGRHRATRSCLPPLDASPTSTAAGADASARLVDALDDSHVGNTSFGVVAAMEAVALPAASPTSEVAGSPASAPCFGSPASLEGPLSFQSPASAGPLLPSPGIFSPRADVSFGSPEGASNHLGTPTMLEDVTTMLVDVPLRHGVQARWSMPLLAASVSSGQGARSLSYPASAVPSPTSSTRSMMVDSFGAVAVFTVAPPTPSIPSRSFTSSRRQSASFGHGVGHGAQSHNMSPPSASSSSSSSTVHTPAFARRSLPCWPFSATQYTATVTTPAAGQLGLYKW